VPRVERQAIPTNMLEVRPVTCCAGFKTALNHFEPRKLGLQLLDPRVQAVDLRPVTTR
jgi:hypothetical protein